MYPVSITAEGETHCVLWQFSLVSRNLAELVQELEQYNLTSNYQPQPVSAKKGFKSWLKTPASVPSITKINLKKNWGQINSSPNSIKVKLSP